VNDPQELLPNLGAITAAFETRGDVDEARALARELVGVARSHPQDAAYALSMDFLFTRVALEHEPELARDPGQRSLPPVEIARLRLPRPRLRPRRRHVGRGRQPNVGGKAAHCEQPRS